MASDSKPTFVGLFCGCGGFDLGFARRGFDCLQAVDNDPLAVETHNTNLGAAAAVGDLRRELSLRSAGSPDVVIAGPPCQGFSTAGRRRHDDPRNGLLTRAASLAVGISPKVVMIENVPGAKAGKHGEYWAAATELLRGAGYATHELLMRGEESGIPQMRKRLVLVGWRTGQVELPPMPVIGGGTLGQALSGLEGLSGHDPQFLEEGSETEVISRAIREGQKVSNVRGGANNVPTWDIPGVFGVVTGAERILLTTLRSLRRSKRHRTRSLGDADPVSLSVLSSVLGFDVRVVVTSLVAKGFVRRTGQKVDLAGTFNGLYWRPRTDGLSPTVDTRFGDPRHFLHPHQNRGFTVREAARIQGFPDSFLLSGRDEALFRLVGNAVPPPMSERLADLALALVRGRG